MQKEKDLTGQRFGRLTVIALDHKQQRKDTKYFRKYWKCLCDCGNLHIVLQDHLTTGKIKSCGCLSQELSTIRATKHGLVKHPLYRVWRGILDRCLNMNNIGYQNYGGRGIIVSQEWQNFENFYEWAINNGYAEGLTIDRIDNNGNYEPNNCKFATMKEQTRNRRSNINLCISNEIHCLKDWCDILKIKYGLVTNRINKLGWTIEEALTTPIGQKRKKKEQGES